MLINNYILKGKKSSLRGLQREDLVLVGRWWDDAEVTYLLEMGLRPTRDKELESFWRSAMDSEDNIVFAICDSVNGQLLGTCGLYAISWASRRAQFNILIGEKDSWDRGVGSNAASLILQYAFEKLNLESVHLGVNSENLRAIASYRKVGFIHEGRRRHFIYRNGRYYDMDIFSILRDEYSKINKD